METTQIFDQLIKYAEDFSEVIRSSREREDQLKGTRNQLFRFAEDLSTTVADLKTANREMQDAYLDTIQRLSLAAEYKDEDTGDHIVRMSRYCALIAEKLALSSREIQNVRYASPMHDIGKIGIPDRVLLKKGKLDNDEFALIKTHTTIGATILSGSRSEILQVAEIIARTHHERFNGRGYPDGLKGEAIPIAGRIVALPDTFDALTSRRPYKDPYPVEVAVDIIRKERGAQFDPAVVDVFLENLDDVLAIKSEVGESFNISDGKFNLSERDRSGAQNA